MNLVIDDAVEVKQATKTTEESRRSLGGFWSWGKVSRVLTFFRSDTLERRQCFIDSELERLRGYQRGVLAFGLQIMEQKSLGQ
jgi:hypothetical protein